MDWATVIVGLSTFGGTALGAFLLHRREKGKEETATQATVEAMSLQLNAKMQAHVEFVETRIQTERNWYAEQLEREKQECNERISELAGKLAAALHGRRSGDP